ncbi:MAG: GNAT family N-acetyltransferase [bacterium]|nr:GNAT family N-acetyltransferase [bacterium]
MDCELCGFDNPKATATAVVIRDRKLLVLKRAEEPFRGKWDLPGGYMSGGELPDEALKRELREELGVECSLDFIGWFPGTAMWKGETFSILSHAYLAELKGEISLNHENSHYAWIPLHEVKEVAFDSNQRILEFIKQKFGIDYPSLIALISQLDSSARVSEINFYRSTLNGYMSKKIVDGKLVGVGWIFPRRTFLRKQAVIEDVVVDQTERGKGYGEEITLDLIRWARENGVEVIELTSGSHRIPANKLYQKVGFTLHPTNHYLLKLTE